MARADQIFHLREHEKSLGFAFAVRTDRDLHISGACGLDAEGKAAAPGDMEVQLRIVYADIAQALAAHGLDFADVVRERIYVTDIQGFRAALPARAEIYAAAAPPAATWVEVSALMRPEFVIEIEVTATLPSDMEDRT